MRLDLVTDKMTCDLTWTRTEWLVTWLGLEQNDLWLDLTWTWAKWLVTWLDLSKMTCDLTWLEQNDLCLDLDLSKMTCDLVWTWAKWLVTWLGLEQNDLWLDLTWAKWLVTWLGLAKSYLLPMILRCLCILLLLSFSLTHLAHALVPYWRASFIVTCKHWGGIGINGQRKTHQKLLLKVSSRVNVCCVL